MSAVALGPVPPQVTEFTADLYGKLAEIRRLADQAQDPGIPGPAVPALRWMWAPGMDFGLPLGLPHGGGRTGVGWPLLRWLSLLGDQVQPVVDLLDRFAYVPEDEDLSPVARRTSDLVDPANADPAWLPWLAMLVGARLDPQLPVAQQRVVLSAPRSVGWRAGTPGSIAAAAQTVLTDTKQVSVVPHYTGDWLKIGVLTLLTETPADADVAAAIAAARVKPTGFEIVVDHYQSSWDLQELRFPTWTAREGAVSWDRIESVQ